MTQRMGCTVKFARTTPRRECVPRDNRRGRNTRPSLDTRTRRDGVGRTSFSNSQHRFKPLDRRIVQNIQLWTLQLLLHGLRPAQKTLANAGATENTKRQANAAAVAPTIPTCEGRTPKAMDTKKLEQIFDTLLQSKTTDEEDRGDAREANIKSVYVKQRTLHSSV